MPYGYLYDGTQDVPPKQEPKVPVDAIDVSSQQTISGGNQYVPPPPQPYGYLYDQTQDRIPQTPGYQVPLDNIEVYNSITISGGNPPDFTISVAPATKTVVQGNATFSTVTTAAKNGFNAAITLSATGQPTGVTVSFSPNPITAPGSGTSSATITVSASAVVGTYTITITGTSGGTVHTTTLSLTVVASSGSTGTGVFVTQIPVETSIAPSDAKTRITQITTETSVQPSDAKVRVTQVVIETSIVYSQATQLLNFDDDTQTPLNRDYYLGINQDVNDIVNIVIPPPTFVDSLDIQNPSLAYSIYQDSNDAFFVWPRQPHVWITITPANTISSGGSGGGGTGGGGGTTGLSLTTTLAAYMAHNTSAYAAYNKANFPLPAFPNFEGTAAISAVPLVFTSVDSSLSDDSYNPVTPCHVSNSSVKLMTPNYSGKRTILVVPYNFTGSGDGSGGHLDFGINTNTVAWAAASCLNQQYRGYDGINIDWYGPNRYEDDVTLKLMAQCESMSNFTFGIMIDTSGGSYSTLAELETYLAYLESTYFGSPAYAKFGGKCKVQFWGPTVLTDAEYNTAKSSISTPMYWIGQGPGSFGMSSMDAAFDWVHPWSNGVSGTDPYNLAAKTSFINSSAASSKGSIQCISCGFNGTLTQTVNWSEGKDMPRDSGECWIQQSALVNSNITHAQSGGGTIVEIQDATWNDWQEGTEMESAIDNSIVVSSSITSNILTWSVSGGTGDETTLSSYVILASPDGINAAILGTQATGGSKNFNLGSITGWGTLTYSIYVIAIGIGNVRSQWSSPILYAGP